MFRVSDKREYVQDSMPAELRAHPYLATVVLEVPDIRPVIRPALCVPRAQWTDSAFVGPVPIPGVDAARSTYRTQFEVDSIHGDTVSIHAVSDVSTTGVSKGDTLLRGMERRDEHWRIADHCRGAASSIGTTTLTLVYYGVKPGVNDTVTATEQRFIAAAPPR